MSKCNMPEDLMSKVNQYRHARLAETTHSFFELVKTIHAFRSVVGQSSDYTIEAGLHTEMERRFQRDFHGLAETLQKLLEDQMEVYNGDGTE